MGGKSILVADDDAATRELVKVVASRAGWTGEIVEAESGAGAIALATEAPVVAAVLDIEMPMLDGVKAAEAIWNYCPKLPITFYSSTAPPPQVGERARAIRKGRLDDLMAALAALLAKKLERPHCDPPEPTVLQALLAARDDNPLMVVDPRGEFRFANCAASDLYDLAFPARGSVFDQSSAVSASGAVRGAESLPFARALETGLPVHDEVRLRKADGSIVVARVTAVPHRAVDGELTSVSLYTRRESILPD